MLVTRTRNNPKPGSDEISKAFEDAWIGGSKQRRLAFLGNVVTATGATITELFIVELPDDVTIPGEGPLEGTRTHRPFPPKGTTRRRLTYTSRRPFRDSRVSDIGQDHRRTAAKLPS